MSYDDWKTDIDSCDEPLEPVEPERCHICHDVILETRGLDPVCSCEAAAFLEDATDHVAKGLDIVHDKMPEEIRSAVSILAMAWLRTQNALVPQRQDPVDYVRQIIADGPGDEEAPF